MTTDHERCALSQLKLFGWNKLKRFYRFLLIRIILYLPIPALRHCKDRYACSLLSSNLFQAFLRLYPASRLSKLSLVTSQSAELASFSSTQILLLQTVFLVFLQLVLLTAFLLFLYRTIYTHSRTATVHQHHAFLRPPSPLLPPTTSRTRKDDKPTASVPPDAHHPIDH